MYVGNIQIDPGNFIMWARERVKRKQLTELQLKMAYAEEFAELQAALAQLEANTKGAARRLAWGEGLGNKSLEREQALASVRHELGDVILCSVMLHFEPTGSVFIDQAIDALKLDADGVMAILAEVRKRAEAKDFSVYCVGGLSIRYNRIFAFDDWLVRCSPRNTWPLEQRELAFQLDYAGMAAVYYSAVSARAAVALFEARGESAGSIEERKAAFREAVTLAEQAFIYAVCGAMLADREPSGVLTVFADVVQFLGLTEDRIVGLLNAIPKAFDDKTPGSC